MAQTNAQLPTTVIPNTQPGVDWLNPNNILLSDSEFAVSGGASQVLTVGNFPINLSQGDTVTNIIFGVKGYRGSFNTTLQIFAVDNTSGVDIAYPLLPSFQGFDGTNTLYVLTPTLFSTTWSINQINNIKIKLIADGELHLDYVQLNVVYTPSATETIYYNTLTGTFAVGDVITGGSSGATATIVTDDGSGQMDVNNVNGVFIVDETITGVPSGATAVIITNTVSGLTVVDEFVQAQPFQLSQSMTATDLFCFLNSFNYPNGDPIAYEDFHGDAMLTIEQGVPNKEENVMITAVDQNYQGTGVCRLSFSTLNNRGLRYEYPYTADSNLRQDHSGTSEIIITNNAPFYSRFLRIKQIDALVSAPITVKDEGTNITTSLHNINFKGVGVTATLNGAHNVDVTIPGVSGSQASIQFEDEGTNLGTSGTVDEVDFIGSGVTASRSGDKVTVNIPGGSGSAVTLQTNGSTNGSQTLLNLKNGSNITIVDDGSGGITINSISPTILLKTNGTNNGSQTTLNLVAGTNITLADNGTGSVTINSTGGSSGASSINALSGNNFTGATTPQPISFGDGNAYRFFGFHNSSPAFSNNLGDIAARTAYTYTFKIKDGNKVLINGIDVFINSLGSPSGQVKLSIQTTSSGNPTGTILSSGTMSPSASPSYQGVSLASTVELSAPSGGGDVVYAIVIERTSSVDPSNYYQMGTENAGGSNVAPYVYGGSSWTTSGLQPAANLYMTYASNSCYICAQTPTGTNSRMESVIVNSGGGQPYRDTIPTIIQSSLGWVNQTVSMGATVSVLIAGSVSGFTSLSPASKYYCDRSDGHVINSNSTSTTIVGKAILTTAILIDRS